MSIPESYEFENLKLWWIQRSMPPGKITTSLLSYILVQLGRPITDGTDRFTMRRGGEGVGRFCGEMDMGYLYKITIWTIKWDLSSATPNFLYPPPNDE